MPFRSARARAIVAIAPVGVVIALAASVPAASASPREPGKPGAGDLRDSLVPPVRWVARHALELMGEKPVANRKPAARPRLPIRGAFDYGEAAARYGSPRPGRTHEGQDLFAPAGTPLVAVRDAVVVEAGSEGGRGNYVALYAPDTGQTYVYLHMQSATPVAVGRRARGGSSVGAVGCTGTCFGDHLHFEVRQGRGANGPTVDPLPLLQRWAARAAGRG